MILVVYLTHWPATSTFNQAWDLSASSYQVWIIFWQLITDLHDNYYQELWQFRSVWVDLNNNTVKVNLLKGYIAVEDMQSDCELPHSTIPTLTILAANVHLHEDV